jgi:ribulose-5-phosphate 4-epimerase/fuculose-1-phosphate aldolase
MGNVDSNVLGKPAHMSDAEWRLRIELAAAYRVFDWYGWNETIFNHITVRVPGPERHFLINPFGLWYDEVTASNLVKVDLQGNPVAP